MSHNLLGTLSEYGTVLVVVDVFVNQLGLPVPAIPTLILAGGLAASGQLPLAQVFIGCVLACLVADSIWYWIGERYGIRVLKTLCRISLEPDSCVSQTQSRFEHWGVNSLVIAKFVPGLSIIAPPMAGALRVGWPRFLGLSALAAILWVGIALFGGILFRVQIEAALRALDHYGGMAAALAALVLLGYVGFKWVERARFFRLLRMARISVSELYGMIQAGAAPVIVDVRSRTARTLEPHWIPGSLHVPLEAVAEHVRDLPRDREIVLYCACPSEATAARVAKILMNQGFRRVRPLFGGLDAWLAAGYAVELDKPPVTATVEPRSSAVQ